MARSGSTGPNRKFFESRATRLVKKPDFQRDESLLSTDPFSELYRRFRSSGLGVPDAAFNAAYVAISEKNVHRLEKRLREEGIDPTEDHRNRIHPLALRAMAFFPRLFRSIADTWHGLGKRLFHRDPGGRSYRASYRFFRAHIPHLLVILLTLICAALTVHALLTPVVLEAQIDGKIIGAVESNRVVDSAVRELEDNVSGILGSSFSFPFEIRYRFARDGRVALLSKTEISDVLYSYLPDYICTGAGLYVDDHLVAVCATEAEIRQELDALTAEHIGKGEDLGILNEILIITQAYPAGSIEDRASLREKLENMTVPPEDRESTAVGTRAAEESIAAPEQISASENTALLCDAEVATVRHARKTSHQTVGIDGIYLRFYRSEILRYQESVPFSVEYVESDQLYTSMEDVSVFGVDGKNNVEAKVYFVDGYEARREILSETVVTEPVNQVVKMGIRVLPETLGVTGIEGRFILPRCDEVSSGFGQRESGFHQGMDIPAPEGANVYASASGKVIAAIGPEGGFTYVAGRFYESYGYCVEIEHEDGYTTLYAHCSKICVTLGQEVKQGEKIAEVGHTGNAFGNHVHFEIRQGGEVRVNPEDGYLYQGTATIYDLSVAAPAEAAEQAKEPAALTAKNKEE